MLTITVSRSEGLQVDANALVRGAGRHRFRRVLDQENDLVENAQNLGTAVIQHAHPQPRNHHVLRQGRIVQVDDPEETTDLARVWAGFGNSTSPISDSVDISF